MMSITEALARAEALRPDPKSPRPASLDAREFTLRGDVLRTADKLTHGDRNRDYGEPVENHRHIAAIANAILGTDRWHLTPRDVALVLISVKLARLAKTPLHKDSYIDAAGYLGIAYECAVAGDDAIAE
jgi:hypothetical protein